MMMRAITKDKVYATLLLIGSCILVAVASDYIADYYENEVPRWVYYCAMIPSAALVGFAYATFIKAFPKKKDKG